MSILKSDINKLLSIRRTHDSQRYIAQQVAIINHFVEELNFDKIDANSLEDLHKYLDSINNLIEYTPELNHEIILFISKHSIDIDKYGGGEVFRDLVRGELLAIKKEILDKIEVLTSNEKIESIKDLVDKFEGDEVLKSKIKLEFTELQRQSELYKEQSSKLAIEEAQITESLKLEYERAKILERKSKVWLSFLERESASTIIGAILLLIIAIGHVLSIAFGFPVPEILDNAFLLILGYFFSQSTKDKV